MTMCLVPADFDCMVSSLSRARRYACSEQRNTQTGCCDHAVDRDSAQVGQVPRASPCLAIRKERLANIVTIAIDVGMLT
jgi:hypothetical protein